MGGRVERREASVEEEKPATLDIDRFRLEVERGGSAGADQLPERKMQVRFRTAGLEVGIERSWVVGQRPWRTCVRVEHYQHQQRAQARRP